MGGSLERVLFLILNRGIKKAPTTAQARAICLKPFLSVYALKDEGRWRVKLLPNCRKTYNGCNGDPTADLSADLSIELTGR